LYKYSSILNLDVLLHIDSNLILLGLIIFGTTNEVPFLHLCSLSALQIQYILPYLSIKSHSLWFLVNLLHIYFILLTQLLFLSLSLHVTMSALSILIFAIPRIFCQCFPALVMCFHIKAPEAHLSPQSVCCCYSEQSPRTHHVEVGLRFDGTAVSHINIIVYCTRIRP
jgi:hypothetical protein